MLHDPILRALHEALPDVARRAGRDVLSELASELSRLPQESPLRVRFAEKLVELSEARRSLRRAANSDAALLRTAALAGDPERALQTLLPRWRSSRGGVASAADKPAWLDRSAVEDRMVEARHAADQRWEFLALATVHQGLKGVPEAYRATLDDAAAEIAQDRSSRWTVRVAALRLLAAAERAGRPEDEEPVEITEVEPLRTTGLDAIERLFSDPAEDPWVIAAATEVWSALRSPEGALRGVLRALRAPEDRRGPDHGLARARLYGQLADLRRFEVLLGLLYEDEPSEHAAMARVRALARSRSPEHLAAVGVGLGRAGAADWRVAAAGAVALLDRLVDGEVAAISALAQGLSGDPHPEALRVTLDAVWRRRSALDPHAPVLRMAWGEALERLRGTRGLTPDAARLIAVVGTWLALATHPQGLARLRAVEARLAEAEEGDVLSFSDGPVADATGAELLDVLFLLAHDDVDLVARPRRGAAPPPEEAPAGGWEVVVGLTSRPRAWRLWHELRHPRNDKRQAWPHHVDEAPEGPYVAWSARLGEVVATDVPGRRVATPVQGSWQEQLPLVANLYAAARFRRVWLRTPRGVEQIEARPGASGLARRFVPLARLRQRLADAARGVEASSAEPDPSQGPNADPTGERAWRDALRAEGFDWTAPTSLPALAPVLRWVGDVTAADAGSGLEVAVIGLGAIAAWATGVVRDEVQARRARAALPLVIGGWGSRGKSSVERMKAAMFQGAGYSVFCKSTGCEAMVLLGTPGAAAQEVFLYRARDKASLHEQRAVTQLAAALRPQVFLYECMALNPAYTELLQQSWMRDDFTTVTNTYPDHEDVQGPSGRDVADVIATFTPRKGVLLTSEQHMTPVLARQARALGSRFGRLTAEDWDLIPRDLLARFPDWAYDRNVALVARLGESLGIPTDEAIRSMADHVVVDLGAFKTYGPLPIEGRSLRFLCGNSANDRASFLSNWERARLDEVSDVAGLSDWQVVVFNNRGDRLARQAMFARIAAMDTHADRVVLIGTNVLPMRDHIEREVREQLVASWRRLAEGSGGRERLVEELSRRLRRPVIPAAVAEARAQAARPTSAPEADWQATAKAWTEECAWLYDLATAGTWDLERALREGASRLLARVLPLANPKTSGDQILERIALLVPAGSRVTILGAENIRGTGLDFVYRWVSVDKVRAWLSDALQGDVELAREALAHLGAWDGWGVWDARYAAEVLERRAERAAAVGLEEEWEMTLETVRVWAARRGALMRRQREGGATWLDWLRRLALDADIVGSVRRRWTADRLYRDLMRLDVGRSRAADEVRRLLDAERA